MEVIFAIVIFDMVKAIIFDAERFSKQLARDYGISTELTTPFFTGPFEKCLIGDSDLKEEIAPYLVRWGWTQGIDSFLEYWFASEHTLDEELIAYIQDLRQEGMTCIVATNQEKHRAEYMLKRMGFIDSFDGLYASAHVGHKKPSMQFYEKVFATLGATDKKDVLFWDDDADNVAGAKEFGINAELYSGFADFKLKMSQYLA